MPISPDVVYDRLLAAASPDVAAWIRAHGTQVGPTVDRTLTAVRVFARWADAQSKSYLAIEGVTGALAGVIRSEQRGYPREVDVLRNLRTREKIVSDGLILRGVKPVWGLTLKEFLDRREGVLAPGFPSSPVVLSPEAEQVRDATNSLENEAERELSQAKDDLAKLGIRGWATDTQDYARQIDAAKGQKKAAWEAYQRAKRRSSFDWDPLRNVSQRILWLESVRQAQAEGRDVPAHVAREADTTERNIDTLRFYLRPSTYIDAVEAGKQIEGHQWGEPEYHDGMKQLALALESIIKDHPTLADIQKDADTLRRLGVDGSHIVASDLSGNRINAYAMVEQEAKKRAASREKRAARKGYEAKSPEYAGLISERARLKREIAEATRIARASPSFRMIGGIATLTATAGLKLRLREVEKKITAIERGTA